MGVSKRNPWLSGLGVLLTVLVMCASQARADVTSDTPGSIVIFPKVIANASRDTLIQLTNTLNMGTSAHCWYFDATNNCQPNNFFVDLTPQQPIWWRVSTGRFTGEQRCTGGTHALCGGPNDPPCAVGTCEPTEGIFLGNVPPRIDFQGELKCIEVDSSGVPLTRNSLKGEALLETLSSGQVSEYNAIAVQGITPPGPTCNGGVNAGQSCTGASSCCDINGLNCGTCNVQLKLDNTTYNACPRDLLATHYAQGASDLFTGAVVRSEITLVPCTEDIENDRPTGSRCAGGSNPGSICTIDAECPGGTCSNTSTPVIANFRVFDEMENFAGSAGIPFTCWLNVSLDDFRLGGIYSASTAGTIVKTRMFGNSPSAANTGIIGVLEEFHTLGAAPEGTATINLHTVGTRSGGDVITVPQQTGAN